MYKIDCDILEDGFGLYDAPEQAVVIRRYTLRNRRGMSAQVISLGASVTSICVPDRKGVFDDVVLGFPDVYGYLENPELHMGATLGRVANRINKGCFRIGDNLHYVTSNEGENHVNGGLAGFDQAVWDSHVEGDKVVFSHLSQEGDEGYPGDLMVQISYCITTDNALLIEMRAMTTKPTIVNLTNSTYFNLAGHYAGKEAIMDHYVSVNAEKFLVTTSENIPTGELRFVGNTVFDLRVPRVLSKMMEYVPQGGYDHTLCLNGTASDGIRLCARSIHPATGRVLEVYSDQPGLVLFTAGNLPELPDYLPSSLVDLTGDEIVDEMVEPLDMCILESVEKVTGSQEASTGEPTEIPKGSLEKPRGPSADGVVTPEQIEEDPVIGTFPIEVEVTPVEEVTVEEVLAAEEVPKEGAEEGAGEGAGAGEEVGAAEGSAEGTTEEDDEETEDDEEASLEDGTPAEDVIDVFDMVEVEEPPMVLPPKKIIGKGNALYGQYGGISFQTMNFPDAVNHKYFPNSILRPGRMYMHTIVYRFTTQRKMKF